MQTVTLLDFDFSALTVTYTTHSFVDGEMRIVEPSSLPRIIRSFNGYVIRGDLIDSVPSDDSDSE